LNEARLKGTKISLSKLFATELKGLDRDLRSDQIISCWNCVASITREEDKFDHLNLSSLYHAPLDSANRAQWNKSLVSGSKKYLESSYNEYVDTTISFYPRDALLGGKPSNIDRIRAFLNIFMKRGSPMDVQKLDLIDGTPIWACIFLLFRCGHVREAYMFACQYEFHLLKTEPNFIAYLKAFIETEDNYLTGTLKAQIQSDYSQRLIVGNQDPYKMTLLKILGRCDLNKKTVQDVITTTQDYIWLQLWLVKDGPDSAGVYNLPALQKLVLDFGPKHFNPKGNNPVQYFETLLAVGLFEDAVAYLFESAHQLDAVHFAISLFYHGIANAMPNPSTAEWDTIVSLKEPQGRGTTRCLNYLKIISTASKSFAVADVIDSVQYLLALPLAASNTYNQVCQDSIRDVILASGNLSSILGDMTADGALRPGIISKFAPLMTSTISGGSSDEQRRFLHSLTKSAAAKCEKDDKFVDAVHLYNLAAEYDKVMQILCRKMSQIFSQAYVSDVQATIYGTAQSVHRFYMSSQDISLRIQPRSLETCSTLLGLLEFKRLAAESQWRSSLQRIEELGIIFLSHDLSGTTSASELDAISAAVERFKTLDDSITCNLSEILLLSMTSIYQVFLENKQFAAQDIGRQHEISKLRRKSRNLMVLVGMLQYRVSQDVCAKMTRMDIFMN
jgi:nuclear pore complex protein Nup93